MILTNHKCTELGLIPEDWDIVSLREIGSFSKGKGISRAEANSGNIPAIRYGEIYTVHNDYIKEFFSFISEEVALSSKKLNYGDVLFTASGETKEDIAKAVAYITKDKEAYVGGDIIILSPTCEVDSMYLGYVLNTKEVIRQRMSKAQGDAVVHITTDAVSSIQIPFPPLKEQKAIAKALSDVDCLIESIAALVAKKRDIKQGVIQQLVSGAKRLDKFDGPWRECKLGEALNYEQPTAYIVSDTEYIEHGIPVLTAGKSFVLGYTAEKIGIYDKGDVIIFDDFTTDSKYVSFPFKAKSSAMKMLTANEGYDLRFMYELLSMIDYKPSDHMRHWIGMFSKLSVSIPSYEEQVAISNILKSMDDDIATLEEKKAKYEAIKQGMMQELLTGKIRLV